MRELSMEEVDQVSGGYMDGYTSAGLILATVGAGAATGPLAPWVWTVGFSSAFALAAAQTIANWNAGTGGGHAAPPSGGASMPATSANGEGGGSD